jgi:hypothetical protein
MTNRKATMKSLFLEEEIAYTGEQLKPHWAFITFDLAGDSIVGFIGPYKASPEFTSDLRESRDRVESEEGMMLHLVVEHFGSDLLKILLCQRLLLGIARDKLNHRLGGDLLQIWGDDICDGSERITTSSATVNTLSGKIHLGIRTEPSKGKGLKDYNINPRELGEVIMDQYRLELFRIQQKLSTTRSVQ